MELPDSISAVRSSHRLLILVAVTVVALTFRAAPRTRIEGAVEEIKLLKYLPFESFRQFAENSEGPLPTTIEVSRGGKNFQAPRLYLWTRPATIGEFARFLNGDAGSLYSVSVHLDSEHFSRLESIDANDSVFVCRFDPSGMLPDTLYSGALVGLGEGFVEAREKVRQSCSQLLLRFRGADGGADANLLPLKRLDLYDEKIDIKPPIEWLQSLGRPYVDLVKDYNGQLVVLPHAAPYLQEIEDFTPREALRYLQGRLDSVTSDSDFEGVGVSPYAYSLLAPAAILLILSYFSVHARDLRDQVRAQPELFQGISWLGFMPGAEPFCLLLTSVFIMPVTAMVILMAHVGQPLAWPTIAGNILGLLLTTVLAGRATIYLLQTRSSILKIRRAQNPAPAADGRGRR